MSTVAEEEAEKVRGVAEFAKQAADGLKLLEKEEAQLDPAAAQKFKDTHDAKIAAVNEESKALTGKDNKKARQEKDKEVAALKIDKVYIDACKVVKGIEPPNGNFLLKAGGASEAAKAAADDAAKAEAVAAEAAKAKASGGEKPKKAQEGAGISKEERDEMEKLKNNIIEKKRALKDSGMSGGQMNKDEDIVKWVTRMNELKEKENPGALQAEKDEKKGGKKKKMDSAAQLQLDEKMKELDEYAEKLRTEFKYSKKEVAADPDYQEMKKEVDKMSK